MQISPRKGLAVRVGSHITVYALLFLTILSFYYYHRTFQYEMKAVTRSLSQLVITVENSAAIASYLNNIEIATEVVQGLTRNDMVSGVLIQSTSGLYLEAGNMTPRKEAKIQTYPVLSPVGNGESVGQLSINPNQQLIEQRARKAAKLQVLNMAIQTLTIVVLVMILVYWQLAKPILFLARQLDEIQPGSTQRLQFPRGHQGNEMGKLVMDTNRLLETVEKAIKKEQSLRIQVESLERRFRLIFERASGGIALTDRQGKLLVYNPSFEKLVGSKSVRELMESDTKILPDIFEQNQTVRETMKQIPLDSGPIAMDLKLVGHEDNPRWLHFLFSSVKDEDEDLLIETICYDISERTLREKQAQLEADIDPLTKLLNRRGGARHLDLLLEKSQKENRSFAIFMIDLDKFKPINDTFGHEGGDIVLCEVAKRLFDTVRQNDFVIRFGGDEFLVVLTEGHRGLIVAPVAKKILSQLYKGIDLGEGQRVHVGGSIGISIYPEHGEEISSLVEQADRAMYKVKNGGRDGYCLAQGAPYFIDRQDTD